MFGIVLIVALVAWGIVRCWRSHQKVIPAEGGATDPGYTFSFKGKVSPFTTTGAGIEDLDTKVPSEDNCRKSGHR